MALSKLSKHKLYYEYSDTLQEIINDLKERTAE